MAGVRGCQRRGDAGPRVGSTPRQCLPQAVMGPPHRGVRQRPPQRCGAPWELCAERLGRARESTMMGAPRQRRAFDNAGLDGRTRRYRGPERGPAWGVSTHDVVIDRHPTTPGARLHHWGRAPLLGGQAPWMGGRAPRATPWRLVPGARHRPQGRAVCRPVSAGTNGEQVRGARRDPFQPHSGCSWRARADAKGDDPAPLWGQRHPDPGIASGVTGGWRPGARRVLRMDHAPPFVPWALADGQLGPRLPRDPPTRRGSAIEPGPPRLVIHRDEPRGRPERMACHEGAHGHFTQRRVMLHIARGGSVRPGDATPTRATHGVALAPRGPMRDHPALVKAHAVKRTDRMGTIAGFPVPMSLG